MVIFQNQQKILNVTGLKLMSIILSSILPGKLKSSYSTRMHFDELDQLVISL